MFCHTVTGLANGVEHLFRIRAINGSGHGAESEGVAATPRPPPAKPAGFQIEAGNTQARLLWTDPGDSSITGWQYSFKTTGDYGAWTDIPGSGAATVRYTVTGLANNLLHTFRLRAVNGSGAGPQSDEASATPQFAAPAKPTGFGAEAGDGQVVLTWNDPDDSSISGWEYNYKTSSGDYSVQWTYVPGSGARTTRHIVTGLVNGAAHTFKIRAANEVNGYESDERTATPRSLRPAAPTGLVAAAGDASVALTWDDPGDTTITGWEYAVKTMAGFGAWMDISGSDATTTAYTATGLDNGKKHVFKLRAVNGHGGGAESAEVSATPVAIPVKPAGFIATPGDGQVALQWTDPDDATITGWEYAVKTMDSYGPWTGIPGSGAETTAYTVTPLDNGESYAFKLRAVNASGNGAESDEATATPVAVPAKPAGFFATPGDGRVSLQWTDPGDATITGWEYAVKAADAYGPWTGIAGSSADTTAHTVAPLDNGASYAFKVRAANASGSGAESDEATATPVPVPAKPTGFTATAGDRQASLQWSDPGDATITGWEYAVKTTGSYGPWTGIPGSGAETTAYTVAPLDNGESYAFKLRAVNASGNGAESDEATAILAAAPAKPAGFAATAGAGEVVLSWDNPNDSTITGWEYNQRPAGGEFEADWTFILGSGAATTRYTIPSLETGATYGFKVRAVAGGLAGAESDEATVTLPSVPAKPADLKATAGDRRVSLEWTASGDSTVTRWQFRYRAGGGGYRSWTDVPNSGENTAGHTVPGLAPGIPHHFRVRAVNSSGPGLESDETMAVPFYIPAKPTDLTATPGSGEVLLEWDDPEDDAITGWEYNRKRGNGDYEEDWTAILNSSAATTSHTVIGLETGASYTFKVRAATGDHTGPESDEVSVTLPRVPAKPSVPEVDPGVNEVSLTWEALGDPTVTLWQYNYRTGSEDGEWTDIPESGPDTSEYTVTGLEAGVSYKFRIRAANNSGFGLASDEIATVPLGRPAGPTGLKAHAGYGQVVLTWETVRAPNIRWQYACWIDDKDICSPRIDDSPMKNISDPCRGPPWIDIPGSSAATTRHTVPGLASGIAHTFQVRMIAGDKCSAGSNPVSATPKEAAEPAERRTVKAVLAGLAGHVAAGAQTVIGARFAAGPTATRVVLAGREVPLFAPVRKEPAQTPPDSAADGTVMGIGGRELLRDSSFQIALGPPGEEGSPQWSLWHRGDLKRFGGSAGPQSRYGGRLLSVWFGADMRWGGRWLFGTAMARSEGELEYAAGAGSGAVETAFDSVHPYLQRRFEDGETAWITFGGGRGTIRNATAGRGVETVNAELATVSAGFRGPLPAFRGLELSMSGEAGFTQLEARGDARTAIGSLSASSDRQSLGIEAALTEEEAAYHSSLSLRRDGGDGVRGLGLELSSGVGSPLPASPGRADIRLRGLVWRSGREYREFGLTATVRQPADTDRGGPSWSLAGAYGAPDSRIGESEPFRSRKAAKRGGGKALYTLDLKAGWRIVSRRGLFEPHAAFRLAGTDGRQLALGVDLGLPAGPVLKLAAARRTPQTGAPESRVSAAMQFRF